MICSFIYRWPRVLECPMVFLISGLLFFVLPPRWAASCPPTSHVRNIVVCWTLPFLMDTKPLSFLILLHCAAFYPTPAHAVTWAFSSLPALCPTIPLDTSECPSIHFGLYVSSCTQSCSGPCRISTCTLWSSLVVIPYLWILCCSLPTSCSVTWPPVVLFCAYQPPSLTWLNSSLAFSLENFRVL